MPPAPLPPVGTRYAAGSQMGRARGGRGGAHVGASSSPYLEGRARPPRCLSSALGSGSPGAYRDGEESSWDITDPRSCGAVAGKGPSGFVAPAQASDGVAGAAACHWAAGGGRGGGSSPVEVALATLPSSVPGTWLTVVRPHVAGHGPCSG